MERDCQSHRAFGFRHFPDGSLASAIMQSSLLRYIFLLLAVPSEQVARTLTKRDLVDACFRTQQIGDMLG